MTEGLRAKGLPPHHMSASNTTDLYWTVSADDRAPRQ